MASDASTPRLVYRGPANECAETATAFDADDLDQKLKAGYRLVRVPVKAAEKAADDTKAKK